MGNEIALIPSRISSPAVLDALDPEEIDGVLHLAENAESANTRLAYRSDCKQFTAWMEKRGAEPLPAPVGLVCAYI